MKLNKIKHVFFDLDHTLWDFDRNSALTFHKIFQLNNIDIETDRFLEVYAPINLNYWKLYREERIDKVNLRYKRLKDSFDKIDIMVEDNIINKLSLDYIDHLTTFNHLFEGTIDILQYLYSKYTLHIITNGFEEAQLRKMTNANITCYFTTITNSEMVGVKKPNIKIFKYALNKAAALPEESVMIGDNYEADILGAKNAKMDTIFINYHQEKIIHPQRTIKTLSQIKNYL